MYDCDTEILKSFILQGMKKYKIKSVMITIIYMERQKLITKEAMEKFCKGEKDITDSVDDDLESFFENLRLGKELDEPEIVHTYFLPKLAEEEMELVERKDPGYSQTFWFLNPYMNEAEMKLSESDLKFIFGQGWRRTFTVENKSSENISHRCNLQ